MLSLIDAPRTEYYTLSLHDALPISAFSVVPEYLRTSDEVVSFSEYGVELGRGFRALKLWTVLRDRKSTRLNSSHTVISYAVFCLKKKNKHYEVPNLRPVHATSLHLV